MSHGFISIYMNPWNTKNIIDIEEPHKEVIRKYVKRMLGTYTKKRKCVVLTKEEESAREYIEKKYNEGYGTFTLAQSIGISKSICRVLLLNWLHIEMRKGRNIATDKTRKFRSERVMGEKNPWYDWPNKQKIHNSRGIQGWYLRKNGEYVWLRSSWEYIYAKWLEENNIEWKYEERVFELVGGNRYLPDFFIYKNGILDHVVEIKGFNKNSIYKTELLRNQYNIDIVLIESIKNYCDDYQKELKKWKSLRLLEKK